MCVSELKKYFPLRLRNIISDFLIDGRALEIRLRVNNPIIIRLFNKEIVTTEIINIQDIREILELVSSYSLYAFEDEIKNGFITIENGHRIGICGQVIYEKGQIKNIKNINSINIRIARAIKGCGELVMPYLGNGENNVLIISPPGAGKTTLLRDLIRIISDKGKNISVIDERGEIAPCNRGIPVNYVGLRTDILDGCHKMDGVMLLLRTMAPDIIALDEIGSKEDADAILQGYGAGVNFIATAHANSYAECLNKVALQELYENHVFNRFVVLSKRSGPGTIESIRNEKGEELL